jgi:hypothetical protein
VAEISFWSLELIIAMTCSGKVNILPASQLAGQEFRRRRKAWKRWHLQNEEDELKSSWLIKTFFITLRLMFVRFRHRPESLRDGAFRRSSGMNGNSLPSEGLFNHACRFRRWDIEAERNEESKSLLGDFSG